jgi:hypothetical protein
VITHGDVKRPLRQPICIAKPLLSEQRFYELVIELVLSCVHTGPAAIEDTYNAADRNGETGCSNVDPSGDRTCHA